MPPSMDAILPHMPAALMVMFRLSGIFMFGPVFGANTVPIRVKVLLALVLTACVYPVIPPQVPLELNMATLGLAIGSEMLIGMVIGYGASLPLAGLQVAGHMMGQQMGLMAAQVFNPDFDDQTEVVGQFMYLVALTVFLLLGGHRQMLTALVHSFDNIPLGGFVPGEDIVQFIIGLLAAMFELGVRVAAPLVCLVFLESIAMGFVARTVPQLNIFSLGFPVRIILGFFLLVGLTTIFFDSVTVAIFDMFDSMAILFS